MWPALSLQHLSLVQHLAACSNIRRVFWICMPLPKELSWWHLHSWNALAEVLHSVHDPTFHIIYQCTEGGPRKEVLFVYGGHYNPFVVTQRSSHVCVAVGITWDLWWLLWWKKDLSHIMVLVYISFWLDVFSKPWWLPYLIILIWCHMYVVDFVVSLLFCVFSGN